MDEIRKVAVLLIALGPAHARRVLDKLGPDEMLVIIAEMRRMSKVSLEERMAVLEEVNDLLENLTAATPSALTSEPSLPEQPAPPSQQGTATSILDQIKDELPDHVDLERLRQRGIDWGAAGFDFGGTGGDEEDDPPPDAPPGRRPPKGPRGQR